MSRLFIAIVIAAGVHLSGCSDPSAPENAPPNYPDTTDPKAMSEMMGGPDAGAPAK